ncbi:MAG: porin family protein [Chitinophagales bacterium]
MKKMTFFFVGILLLFSNVLNAQNWRFGLTLAPTTNWLTNENKDIETSSKLSLGYGLIADYQFDERYAVSTGFFFNKAAAKFTPEPPTIGDTSEISLKVQYVEIPLTLKLKTNEFGYLTYFAQVGLTPGLALNSRYDQEISGGEDIVNEKAKKFVNNINLSATIGGGLEYSISETTSLFAGLFFQNGLLNVIEDNDGDRMSFGSLSLRLGIFF